MVEKNVWRRVGIIAAVLLVAVLLLTTKELRPGNDIAGAVSLVFELTDDTDTSVQGNVIERVKDQLQKRVDPNGVYGLTWRVHGKNRLEVQMPFPPEDVDDYRNTYQNALDDLYSTIVTRGDLLAAFSKTGEERDQAIAALNEWEIAGRTELLQEAAQWYDEWQAAITAVDQLPEDASEEDARAARRNRTAMEEEYIDAVDALFTKTNLSPQRFEDILERDPESSTYKAAMEEWTGTEEKPGTFFTIKDKIAAVVEANRELNDNARFLDGPADLIRRIKGAGVLCFRIVEKPDPAISGQYAAARNRLEKNGPTPGDSWYKVNNPVDFFNFDSPKELQDFDYKTSQSYVIGKYDENYFILASSDPTKSLIGGPNQDWKLASVFPKLDSNGLPAIGFSFDPRGARKFGELTAANVNQSLGIFVDDEVYSAPNIRTKISGHGEITGRFTQDKVNYLVSTMEAGALPGRLKETPISERTLGSALGKENLDKSLKAGWAGLIAVIVIMLVIYLISGGIASVALGLNIILVLAAMAFLDARITLPGIAGIILTIGMSVDANVLIFERMREEKERGSSLRMIIKNGYDKAFSTIIDANITTLLTCIIIAKVGSEEIKGFGITLGWGIVVSLFTALFVTRTLFALLVKYHIIKDIKMRKIIGVPKVDWYAKRKFFVPLSAVIIIIGIALMGYEGTKTLGTEFIGGVDAELKIKTPMEESTITNNVMNAANTVAESMKKIGEAKTTPVSAEEGTYAISIAGCDAKLIAAMLAEPMEDDGILSKGGVDTVTREDALIVRLVADSGQEQLNEFLQNYAKQAATDDKITNFNVSEVLKAADVDEEHVVWTITTTETNKRLVQYVIEQAFGNNLDREPAIEYHLKNDTKWYPVTARTLSETVGVAPANAADDDITVFDGGVALYFHDLNPPIAPVSLDARLKNMRLQPDFAELPFRQAKVVGIKPSQANDGTYTSMAIVVADPDSPYQRDSVKWEAVLASSEYKLATETLAREQSLRRFSQFKPQIASQSQERAIVALLLSWVMIIGYLWLRFGRATYGLAGVAALVHDILIAFSAIGFSFLVGKSGFLWISEFHIDMTIVAAFLTIIGYSINDTIVIFDRIRETRGRIGKVTPQIINDSINQCLSRTLMTSVTTLIVLGTMYIWGGQSIRGFNYCMIVGIITGTYSSIAIAAPILMFGMKHEKIEEPTSQATTA